MGPADSLLGRRRGPAGELLLQHVALGGGLGVTVHLLVGRPGLGPPGVAFRVSPRPCSGSGPLTPHPRSQIWAEGVTGAITAFNNKQPFL